MLISRRQLASYGLSVADLARTAGISYARTYSAITGAQNLTAEEQRRVIEVIATAAGNARRIDALSMPAIA